MKPCNKQKGFTLIEVLIALAIIAIALTAIIRATSQNIRQTIYLQNKTIASWVATNVMNEARAGLLELSEDEKLEKETVMLGQSWNWTAELKNTPNAKIKKITVDVFRGEQRLIEVVSYVYQQ